MTVLPPAPNWYCNHGASCTEEGIYAFAARSDVYIFDLNAVPAPLLQSLDRCHSDRVTTVCIQQDLLFTASEDGKVKRWDWRNKKCLSEHSAHGKVKVVSGGLSPCLPRSSGGGSAFATGDEQGKLVVWQHRHAELQLLSPSGGAAAASGASTHADAAVKPLLTSALLDGSPIFTVAFSRNDPALLAAGTRKCFVYVLAYSGMATSPATTSADMQPVGNALPEAAGKEPGPGGRVPAVEGLRVLMKLKGHDDEIHSIVWAPRAGSQQLAGLRHDDVHQTGTASSDGTRSPLQATCPYDLASGSKDRTIKLWSLAKQRCTATLRLPTNTGVWQPPAAMHGRQVDSAVRLWVTLAWQRDAEIVSSTHGGQLLVWDLTPAANAPSTAEAATSVAATPVQQLPLAPREQPQQPATAWRLLDDARLRHSRIVFTAAPWGNDRLVTTSMDRAVVVWDLRGGEAVQKLFALGGFAYAIRASPHDPGRLAIGVGDSMIRVWNVNASATGQDVKEYWRGIKAKVTTIAWHPWCEGRLAYGTEDGRVGVQQLFGDRAPVVFSAFHKNTVYVVAWGPLYTADGSRAVAESSKAAAAGAGDIGSRSQSSSCPMAVYSVGDGVILLHDLGTPDGDPVELNALLELKNPGIERRIRSEVSWSEELALLAIGNDDGSVLLVRCSDLGVVCQVRVCQKLVNALRWHPYRTAVASASKEVLQPGASVAAEEHENISPCHGWLAIGSNDDRVFVVNLASYADVGAQAVSASAQAGSSRVVLAPLATLTGHLGRVTDLCWSVHEDARLATASYDGSVVVWNVLTGSMLAVLRGHCGRVLTCLWSQLDADIIYSGGDDFSVREWHVSQCPASAVTVDGITDGRGRQATDVRKKKAKKSAKKKQENGSTPHQQAQVSKSAAAASANPDGLPGRVEERGRQSMLTAAAGTPDDLLALLQLRKEQLLQKAANSCASATECQTGSKPVAQPIARAVGAASGVCEPHMAGTDNICAASVTGVSATVSAAAEDGGKLLAAPAAATCVEPGASVAPVAPSLASADGIPRSPANVPAVPDGNDSGSTASDVRVFDANQWPRSEVPAEPAEPSQSQRKCLLGSSAAAAVTDSVRAAACNDTVHGAATPAAACELTKPRDGPAECAETDDPRPKKPTRRKKEKALITAAALASRPCASAGAATEVKKEQAVGAAASAAAASCGPRSSSSQLAADCLYIGSALRGEREMAVDDEHLHLGLFLGKRATHRFLDSEVHHLLNNDAEKSSHGLSGNAAVQSALQLLLWRGDVEKALELAADHGWLTDWLVSAAAMISFECHLKHSEIYARQLAASGSTQKAASYYLVCHKTREAIKVLLDGGFYGDALCIAQSHLVEDDPLTLTVHRSWAEHLARSGSHELAARSWLSCKQPLEAVRSLARRADAESRLAAAELATACALDVEARVHADIVWRQALISGPTPDWSLAERAAAVHPDGKALQRHAIAYRHLLNRLAVSGNGLPPVPKIGDVTTAAYSYGGPPLLSDIMSDWRLLDIACDDLSPAASLRELEASIAAACSQPAVAGLQQPPPPGIHEALFQAAGLVADAAWLLLLLVQSQLGASEDRDRPTSAGDCARAATALAEANIEAGHFLRLEVGRLATAEAPGVLAADLSAAGVAARLMSRAAAMIVGTGHHSLAALLRPVAFSHTVDDLDGNRTAVAANELAPDRPSSTGMADGAEAPEWLDRPEVTSAALAATATVEPRKADIERLDTAVDVSQILKGDATDGTG